MREDYFLNSILLVFFMSLTCWASMISCFITIPNISALLSIMVSGFALIHNKNLCFNIKTINYFVLLFLLLFFSLVINNDNSNITYLSFYLVFGVTSIVLSNLKYDGNIVIKYSIYTYLIYICVFLTIIESKYSGIDTSNVQMGWAYSFVPGILWSSSLLLHPKLFTKDKVGIKFISIIVFIGCSFVILFRTITRGAILASLIGILLIGILNLNRNTKIILLFVTITMFSCVWFYLDDIFQLLFFNDLVSDIGAINKLQRMYEVGEVSNGRDYLFRNALDIIVESPIIGHGVGYYEIYNKAYVHQIILQLLCEVGIVGLLIILCPLLNRIIKIILFEVNYYSLVVIVLAASTLVCLSFSNVYWLLPNFWLMFFIIHNKSIEFH